MFHRAPLIASILHLIRLRFEPYSANVKARDDILEILSEYLADANGFDTFSSRSIFFGAPGKDIRSISVNGALGDNELLNLDFQELIRRWILMVHMISRFLGASQWPFTPVRMIRYT